MLAPGDQLPTVREVAAELRINFNTVARGYRLLHDEGIISTQQGRGTYVCAQAPPEQATRDRQALLRELITGWLAEAERLGYQRTEIETAWRAMSAASTT